MKMMRNWFVITMLIVSVFAITACGSSEAVSNSEGENAANESQEKKNQEETTEVEIPDEIRLVVQYSAGGGFDTISRILAPFVEKNLSEGTRVLVVNKPGGEGAIAINDIINSDKGATFGVFNLPGNAVGQVATGQFNLEDIAWLGSAVSEPLIALTSPNSGLNTFDDLLAADSVKGAAAAITGTDGLGFNVLNNELGFNNPNLLTLGGGREAVLTVVRGDADLVIMPYSSYADMIDSGDLKPLFIIGRERLEVLPDVPTIIEEGVDNQAILDLNTMHRAFGMSANTDPAVIEVMREAVAKSIQDPEFVKKAAESNIEVTYTDAAAVETAVKGMIEAIKPYEAEIKAAIK